MVKQIYEDPNMLALPGNEHPLQLLLTNLLSIIVSLGYSIYQSLLWGNQILPPICSGTWTISSFFVNSWETSKSFTCSFYAWAGSGTGPKFSPFPWYLWICWHLLITSIYWAPGRLEIVKTLKAWSPLKKWMQLKLKHKHTNKQKNPKILFAYLPQGEITFLPSVEMRLHTQENYRANSLEWNRREEWKSTKRGEVHLTPLCHCSVVFPQLWSNAGWKCQLAR